MELKVLGKYGPYPAKNGACSGYVLKNEDDEIVLDMGSGVLSRLYEYEDINKVENIFVSHHHFDHTSDLLPLQYMLEDLNHNINIYTKYEDSQWYKILFSHPNFNVINVDERDEIRIGSIALNFVRMEHLKSSLAVMIRGEKTFCYTGDTMYCPAVEKCFNSSDVILADCSKPSGFKAKHMTVDEAKKLSLEYPDKLIIATHQSVDYDPKEELKDYKNIISAQENETYKF